jgi:hypothetical protein
VAQLFQMHPSRHELIIYAHCGKPHCPNRLKNPTFAAK